MARIPRQFFRDTKTVLDAYTGPAGEPAFDTTEGRLRMFDGATAGGKEHALLSEILRQPTGRITLTSGVPILESDVTAAASIYFTPHNGARVPIYDGDTFFMRTFAELTLALSSNSGHTGYHQSGKNFDLFVVNDNGVMRLVSGPAWTNDTTRSAAVSMIQGVYTNTASMTARFGSASGNTLTVAAGCGTLVGTFRASADGQTQFKFGGDTSGGSEVWFGFCNLYNPEPMPFSCKDSSAGWTYGSATVRQSDNSAQNRASFVRCVNSRPVHLTFAVGSDLDNGESGIVGIGIDSTTAISSGMDAPRTYLAGATTASQIQRVNYDGKPGLGFHYFQALEASSIGTIGFYNLTIRGIAWH